MTHHIRDLVGRILRVHSSQVKPNPYVRLLPEKPVQGRMLLSYATNVYERLLRGEPINRKHISSWHNFQISRTFLDLGFQVDVIPFEGFFIVPDADYDVMVDIVSNIGRLADKVGSDCIKILHPMFSHWTVHNFRNYARHAALAQRRGVALKPKRLVKPNDSVERANYITCRGGAFSRGSYDYGSTPILQLPQLTPAAINDYLDRDMDKCKNQFVWLGGSGLVHKGLDLLLEAFAGLPDCHLTVCGNVSVEKSFVSIYQKELYDLPNIETIDWIDTLSEQFRQIATESVAIILPSASELSCGSVIAGMMTGLIPVTTPSSDIDVKAIGFSIEDDSVDAIRSAVCAVRDHPVSGLADMSRASWEAARQRYGRDKFLHAYREAICGILNLRQPDEWVQSVGEIRVPEIKICTI
jgi:glycosyltransferase involved in cell wall biosynthesis